MQAAMPSSLVAVCLRSGVPFVEFMDEWVMEASKLDEHCTKYSVQAYRQHKD